MTGSSIEHPGVVGVPSDVRPLADEEGGESACWAALVCPECGRLVAAGPPTRCEQCGTALTVD